MRRTLRRYLVVCACVAFVPSRAAIAQPAAPPSPQQAPRSFSADDILYFALVDRFADGDSTNNPNVDRSAKGAFHGGDLKGLRANLDEIASLGVTALWITPVVKNIEGFVTGAGFPDWAYHGYWADDFTRLDPRFGTESDLKSLVDDCHARGIKVLLDVVYNHVGYGSRYLTDPATKDWLRSEAAHTCGTDDLTQCVSGLPDLKTERPEVAEFLFQAHLGLAKRVGLDGFRLDTVKHVGHPFWKEHRRRSRAEVGPGFFLLGEVWGGDPDVLDPWFAGDEMDAGIDFSFQGSVIAFLEGRGRTVAFDRYLKSRERKRAGYQLAHFLSSHDVPTALWLLHGDKQRYRLGMVLLYTSQGLPVLYYGEEVGRLGGDWPDNRSDMPWGGRSIRPGAGQTRDDSLRADVRRLVAIRRAHPALSRGVHTGLPTGSDLLLFAQRDSTSGDVVVVAVNRGDAAARATFDKPTEWGARPVRDAWNEIPIAAPGGRVEVLVEAKTARIFTDE